MDITKCYSSASSGNVTRTIRLGAVQSPASTSPGRLRWRAMWEKFKKEKRKLFESPAATRASYDQRTYAKNFDQGCAWDDPENVSRSFSVRFADPSLNRGVM